MFRPMRRKNQALPLKECEEILMEGKSGVLALSGDNLYPYAVPLNYVYHDAKIYFHCAKSGHKLDAISRNNRASFCVVAQDDIKLEEYTSYFKSVIAFGTVRIMDGEEEKRRAIEILSIKYAPGDSAQNRDRAIEREWEALCMLEMTIEHLTGKEGLELARARRNGL